MAADGDAIDVVRDRLGPRGGFDMGERAELVRMLLVRLILKRVRVHGIERESVLGGDFVGVARTKWWMVAQSSSLSNRWRGSPGPGKRAKRVPPVPTPQVGIATPNAMTLRVSASPSMPRRPSARANAA